MVWLRCLTEFGTGSPVCPGAYIFVFVFCLFTMCGSHGSFITDCSTTVEEISLTAGDGRKVKSAMLHKRA